MAQEDKKMEECTVHSVRYEELLSFQKHISIYVSGSQTENMMAMINTYLKSFKNLHPNGKINMKIVNSPYNASKATQSWKTCMLPMEKINVPVFGVRIPEALSALFEMKSVQDTFQLFRVPLPKMVFDTFVQKYGCETIDQFVSYLREKNGNNTEEKFAKFLENFSARLKSLDVDTITSMDDWDSFMLSVGFSEGWKSNLFFEEFLMMFGFTHDEAVALLNTKIEKKKGDTIKITDVREEYVNWTIKCTSCWRYPGCMTDLVAAVFAAMEKTFTTQKEVDGKLIDMTSREKEQDVVDTILSYVKWLKKPDRDLWTPDMQFMDCEMDDMYSIIINDLNCRIAGHYFKMVAQLPGRSQEFEHVWTFLIRCGFTVFHDEESTNGKQVLDTFKTILAKKA